MNSKFQLLEENSNISRATSSINSNEIRERTKNWIEEQDESQPVDDQVQSQPVRTANTVQFNEELSQFRPKPVLNRRNSESLRTRRLDPPFSSDPMGNLASGLRSSTPARNVEQPQSMNATFTNSYPRFGYSRSLSENQIAARLEKEPLPNFFGSISEWAVFYSTYQRTTQRCGYTDEENLGRLVKSLSGDARNLVKGRLTSPNAVKSIIETLYRNYGRPDLVLEELMKNIEKYPNVTEDRIDLLLQLSALVEDLCSTLQCTSMAMHNNNPLLLTNLIRKLPFHLQMGWTIHIGEREASTLETFNRWLITMANAASRIPKCETRQKNSESKQSRSKSKNPIQTIATHDATPKSSNEKHDSSNDKQDKCVACKLELHSLETCKKCMTRLLT